MKAVTVYIDILFIINLVTDYFLLLATASLRRLKFSRLRLVFGAVFGGLYSCAVFFAPLKILYSVMGKIAASLIIVLIAYPIKGIKPFLINTLCFYACSVALAGIAMGVELLFSPENMLLSNGEIYINISAFALILIAAFSYIAMLLVSKMTRYRGADELKELEITVNGKTQILTALFDSGNLLTDTLSGAYVIIVSLTSVKKLIPAEILPVFYENDLLLAEHTDWQKRLCLIPCTSISGDSMLIAFRPDSVRINGAETEKKTVIAVRNEAFSDEYDAIVGAIT